MVSVAGKSKRDRICQTVDGITWPKHECEGRWETHLVLLQQPRLDEADTPGSLNPLH